VAVVAVVFTREIEGDPLQEMVDGEEAVFSCAGVIVVVSYLVIEVGLTWVSSMI